MTDQAIRVVPAGWYEDPASSAHVRWWNGLAWTEHTTLKPTPAPVTPSYAQHDDGFGTGRYGDGYATGQIGGGHTGGGQTGTADEISPTGSTHTGSVQTPETLARIAEARNLERQYGISTAENDVIMRAAHESHGTPSSTTSDYRPWNAEPEPEYDEPSTSTASAWFIALWPVLTLAASAVAAYLAFYVMPEPSFLGIPLIAAVVLVPTVLSLIWAATDAHRLRTRGFEPASAGLAFLGPLVYLIGRRTRVPGSGPLVALILLTLVAVGAPTAAFMTGTAVPVTKAVEIQQAVHAKYVGGGQLASVSCPVFVENLQRGSLYECRGVLPDGGSKIVWVSIDTADLQFSSALSVR